MQQVRARTVCREFFLTVWQALIGAEERRDEKCAQMTVI